MQIDCAGCSRSAICKADAKCRFCAARRHFRSRCVKLSRPRAMCDREFNIVETDELISRDNRHR